MSENEQKTFGFVDGNGTESLRSLILGSRFVRVELAFGQQRRHFDRCLQVGRKAGALRAD